MLGVVFFFIQTTLENPGALGMRSPDLLVDYTTIATCHEFGYTARIIGPN